MILIILDILRIAIVCQAFFFGYQIGFAHGYDPFAQLHFMIPLIIVAMGMTITFLDKYNPEQFELLGIDRVLVEALTGNVSKLGKTILN